jgi:hypothetical protein
MKFTLAISNRAIFNPENRFLGTKVSNLLAGGSLSFVGHWKQGSSSVLPLEQEQGSNWTFKNQ